MNCAGHLTWPGAINCSIKTRPYNSALQHALVADGFAAKCAPRHDTIVANASPPAMCHRECSPQVSSRAFFAKRSPPGLPHAKPSPITRQVQMASSPRALLAMTRSKMLRSPSHVSSRVVLYVTSRVLPPSVIASVLCEAISPWLTHTAPLTKTRQAEMASSPKELLAMTRS
jgi:hypothetical protein